LLRLDRDAQMLNLSCRLYRTAIRQMYRERFPGINIPPIHYILQDLGIDHEAERDILLSEGYDAMVMENGTPDLTDSATLSDSAETDFSLFIDPAVLNS
jgi:hypothetical protein